MNIGLTYDLRQDYLDAGYSEEQTAEFDSPATIAAIDKALIAMGHKTMRIGNVKSLVQRLAAGERWDMVFNICEGMFGLGREAQVPALLDAYQIPYTFSGPLVLALTLDKALTKRVVRSLGVATPDFAVVAAKEDIAAVDLPFPLFAKPLAEGTGLGIDARSKIDSRRQLTCRLLRITGKIQAAGAGGDLSARSGVHRRHCRQRHCGRGRRRDGSFFEARGRSQCLFICQQGEQRGIGPVRAGARGRGLSLPGCGFADLARPGLP